MIEKGLATNAASHVNRIPGVHLDEAGFIHTQFGTYHPVTSEGLPINAPDELMQKILVALIEDGIDSGPAEEFDLDQLVREMGRD